VPTSDTARSGNRAISSIESISILWSTGTIPSEHLGIIIMIVSARCNIYIDVSVCLSVTFVHCGHRVQWIPDTFACLDRWMSLLPTDNASPGSLDGMMPGFLVEEGVICTSLYILT